MLKTKNICIIALLALFLFMSSASAQEIEVNEGYARVTFKELYQAMVVMGGLDIDDPEIMKEYVKLAYCDLFRKHYHNDIEWNDLTREIYSSIADRRENYRIMYEFVEALKLERYNFEEGYFPLSKKSRMDNIGSVILLDAGSFISYCPVDGELPLLPKRVGLVLTAPLTLNKLAVPADKVEEILIKMEEAAQSPEEKTIYARIRFRVTDAPGLYYMEDKDVAYRAEVRGNIQAIDFFYDRELTQPAGFVEIAK